MLRSSMSAEDTLRTYPMAENILYIHGAHASPTTFSRMVDRLPDHHAVFADYDCLATAVSSALLALDWVTLSI